MVESSNPSQLKPKMATSFESSSEKDSFDSSSATDSFESEYTESIPGSLVQKNEEKQVQAQEISFEEMMSQKYNEFNQNHYP